MPAKIDPNSCRQLLGHSQDPHIRSAMHRPSQTGIPSGICGNAFADGSVTGDIFKMCTTAWRLLHGAYEIKRVDTKEMRV